jgi:hypothetical protein
VVLMALGLVAVLLERFVTEDEPEHRPEPPVYATHEDALRDVMRSGRAAVFEADDRGEYRKTWEESAPHHAVRDEQGRR